jgi:hypothetical protein
MPGHQYRPAKYAFQRVVENFGNLLFALEEHHLTNTYAVVFQFGQRENIDFLVLRYLNTGSLSCEEFSEEWLFDGEVLSSSTLETVCAIGSIWKGRKRQR